VDGDRTAGRFGAVKQGSLLRARNGVHAGKPKSRSVTELRVSIVARKRGNARGAKGRRKVDSVNDKHTETQSAAVPPGAKQAEETQDRWSWVERSVWSERMLEVLANGVKGDQWLSLIDKVWKEDNLSVAWLKTTRNGGSWGVDGQSIRQFNMHLDRELKALQQELLADRYTPRPVRRCWIAKLGSKEKRPLGIPAVPDRIVQGAIRHVLEPIFEREFAEHSYGFRPGRGCKDAFDLAKARDLASQPR